MDRQWKDGDEIRVGLPFAASARLTNYSGVDQIKGYEGKRYALQIGPMVLALVAIPPAKMSIATSTSVTTVLPLSGKAKPADFLVEDPPGTGGFKRSWSIMGVSGFCYVFNFEVPAALEFTTYPVFGK